MNAGEILSHAEMCQAEGTGMLQRGMHFRPPPLNGVILMSQRPNAPYRDSINQYGVLHYEGHDVLTTTAHPEPKRVDQVRFTQMGRPTENGKFADWTDRFKAGEVPPARFHVYEKVMKGVWAFRGAYVLRDYSYGADGRRNVFVFRLEPTDDGVNAVRPPGAHDVQTRQIPTWVKRIVYQRDRGRCVVCHAADHLHFDHDLPFSKGGASATPENVRILCARHNLEKGPRIE